MSNQVFYNDMNVGRRDILETVNKQNVYYWQIYIKYLYERSQTEKHHKNFVYEESRYISKFLAYIYEYMNDIEITHITGDDLDEYAYFLSTQLGLSYHGICREMLSFVRCYKYLFGKGLVPESDVLNYKMKRKGREIATNLITDEQIQLASEKLPDNLKMYMMFSLSTGIRMEDLLVLKWNQIDIDKRVIRIDDKILYFNVEVSEMLQKEKKIRQENEFNDYGFVFRGQHQNPEPISKIMISRWCGEIGEIIGVKNLRHLDFRHTAIKRFLKASGSVGMTSIILDCPHLNVQARFMVNEEANNELLQKYKDICEI